MLNKIIIKSQWLYMFVQYLQQSCTKQVIKDNAGDFMIISQSPNDPGTNYYARSKLCNLNRHDVTFLFIRLS